MGPLLITVYIQPTDGIIQCWALESRLWSWQEVANVPRLSSLGGWHPTQHTVGSAKARMSTNKLKKNNDKAEIFPVALPVNRNVCCFLLLLLSLWRIYIFISLPPSQTVQNLLCYHRRIIIRSIQSASPPFMSFAWSVTSDPSCQTQPPKYSCLLLCCPGWLMQLLSIVIDLPTHLMVKLQRAKNNAAHIVFRTEKQAMLHLLHLATLATLATLLFRACLPASPRSHWRQDVHPVLQSSWRPCPAYPSDLLATYHPRVPVVLLPEPLVRRGNGQTLLLRCLWFSPLFSLKCVWVLKAVSPALKPTSSKYFRSLLSSSSLSEHFVHVFHDDMVHCRL